MMDDSQKTEQKHDADTQLLSPRQLRPPKDGNGQHENGDVGTELDAERNVEEAQQLKTFALELGMPRFLDWRALKDHDGHFFDALAGEKGNQKIAGPCHGASGEES